MDVVGAAHRDDQLIFNRRKMNRRRDMIERRGCIFEQLSRKVGIRERGANELLQPRVAARCTEIFQQLLVALLIYIAFI